MELVEWLTEAASLAKAQKTAFQPDETYLRECLAAWHALACNAPNIIHDEYRKIRESFIENEATKRSENFLRGKFWQPMFVNANNQKIAHELGAHIRSLDVALCTFRSHHGPATNSDSWYVATTEAFVIPRRKIREPNIEKRERQTYLRRGILWHRIFPKRILGYEICPIWQDTVALTSENPQPLRVGAALFEKVKLEIKTNTNGFFVSGAKIENGDATLNEHLRKTVEETCFCVVWPELCISPDMASKIRGYLKHCLLDPGRNRALQFVVAGSWHYDAESQIFNTSIVYDAYGNERLRHNKIIRFYDKKSGLWEGIVPGDKIFVLLLDDLAVSFGICKDFCDVGLCSPYVNLDVDLILVPSMGDEQTVLGHRTTATAARTRRDARAFVVQQLDPDAQPSDAAGWVLPLLDSPANATPGDLKQAAIWRSYTARLRAW
jgi:hypothetical protein